MTTDFRSLSHLIFNFFPKIFYIIRYMIFFKIQQNLSYHNSIICLDVISISMRQSLFWTTNFVASPGILKCLFFKSFIFLGMY